MTEYAVQNHALRFKLLRLSGFAAWNPSRADSAFLILKLIYVSLINLRD